MAFQLWVDDNQTEIGTNILSEINYTNLTQRQEGFKAGQTASAINVNSGLRQANLVACALMDALNITNESLQTSRNTLTGAIQNKLNNNLTGYIKLNGQESIPRNLIASTTSFNLGSANNRWGKLYCTDVDIGATSVKNTMQTLGERIDSTQQYISGVQQSVDKMTDYSSYVRTNYTIDKFNFTRSSFVRMGNLVLFSFEGKVTQNTQSTTLENFSNANTNQFLPFDDLMVNSTMVGSAYSINPVYYDSTLAQPSNVGVKVQYNSLYHRIEMSVNSGDIIWENTASPNGVQNQYFVGSCMWFTIEDIQS